MIIVGSWMMMLFILLRLEIDYVSFFIDSS